MSKILLDKCIKEAEKLGIGKDNYLELVNKALEIYHAKEGEQNASGSEAAITQN